MKHQRDIQLGSRGARRRLSSRNGGRAARPIYARRSFLFLTLIMVVSCATVMAVITASLYRNEIREQRELLQATAQSQARLIEAIARYDANVAGILRDAEPGYDAAAATLSQIINAHEQYGGFGKTGEFTLARRDGNSIVFILRHRHGAIEHPTPVAFDSDLAEPMRRALNGLSGTVIGPDYRGETVMAAHEPVAVLNLGIVAKIDMAEIRKPFIRSGLSAAAISLVVVLAGVTAFFWVGKPIVARLEAHSQDLEKEIEDREQAEQQLKQERDFNATVLQTIDSLVIVLDGEGRIISFNSACEQCSGFRFEDIKGRGLWDVLIPPEQREAAEAVFKQLHDHAINNRFENFWLTKDGRRRRIEWTNTVLCDPDGKVQYVIGTGLDVTEGRILEDRLRQAMKMDAVGRLAGGIAHDFNNILSVILGNAELALGEADMTQPIQAELMEIQKAAQRSADLTRQLLTFARRQEISPKVLDLNKTIEGVLKMLERLIGEDIDLVWRPGADLWPAKIDPGQVDQVLANLCVNARQAIDGVGKIIIETQNSAIDEGCSLEHSDCVPGEYVRLVVSDSGCGMDAETLSHVFEPFFTSKGVGEGTGLGLATVYGIVKQNNGFVNVCSEPGQGTTLTICLPRHVGKVEQVRDGGQAKPAKGGHETVLLVEDDLAILEVGKAMLEGLGYHVLEASAPGKAIELAQKHTGEIDLLLTDVVMPEMNGRDLAKRLLSLCPGLKQLFMSAYTSDVVADHGVLDDGIHFIQKPFTKQSLDEKVREALDSK